jgi:hypothetical protein
VKNNSLLDTAAWRKSSYSSAEGACVGVARPFAPIIGIRDTKAPDAGYLTVSPKAFNALLNLIRARPRR